MLNDRIARLLQERQPGHSLPHDLYVDEDIFKARMKAVFETDWLFACNTCEILRPGEYVAMQVGDNPVVILRSRDSQVAAFHNSCRHRRSMICQKTGPRQPSGLSLSSMGL